MEEEINKKQRGVIGTIIVVLLLILILALILWRQNDGEAGETTAVFSTTTVTLTFSELNEDPQQYRDQRIRVTGDYAPVQPLTCAQEREFGAAWRLIGEALALQAQGLEPLLRLVPSATTLTVEGIWRKYEGLVGCTPGEIGVIWYLQAETIVEPNPLTNLVGTLPPTALPLTVLPLPEGTTATATPTEATPSATPIMTTAVTITPTPTTDQFVTASPTSSTPTTNVTPSGTPASGTTPTFTATPTRIDPSRTVSPTPTPTTTATAAVATIPPTATLPSFATATPGSGYPGQPINTPVPIATPVPPTAYP